MQAVISWVIAHQFLVAGFVASLLDLVFALSPSWESNGVLHWIYLQVQKKLGRTPPAP